MYKCGHCLKEFRTKRALFNHMDKYIGECGNEIDMSGEDRAIEAMEKGTYECETSYTE